jgi:hypothetical protein
VDDLDYWRIAQINMEPRPFAIIRNNGLHGDEFIAHGLSAEGAATLRKMLGIGAWPIRPYPRRPGQ